MVLLALALAGALLLVSPGLRGRLSGVIMLFTQQSVHTLAGYLRAAGALAAPSAVLLAAVHAALLPWLPRLLPLASEMVFGGGGWALSLVGALCGGSLCFGLSRLLLRPVVVHLETPRLRHNAALGGAIVCAALLIFPGATGFVGYLAGGSALPFRRYVLGALPGEAATLLLTALCCSPYSTRLPASARLALALAGAALLVMCFLRVARILKKRGSL